MSHRPNTSGDSATPTNDDEVTAKGINGALSKTAAAKEGGWHWRLGPLTGRRRRDRRQRASTSPSVGTRSSLQAPLRMAVSVGREPGDVPLQMSHRPITSGDSAPPTNDDEVTAKGINGSVAKTAAAKESGWHWRLGHLTGRRRRDRRQGGINILRHGPLGRDPLEFAGATQNGSI